MEESKMLELLRSTIRNCQTAQKKFIEGSSQYSLLKNRIAALEIAVDLIVKKNTFTKDQLQAALPPIESIFYKCQKSSTHLTQNTNAYKRMQDMMETMSFAKRCITQELIVHNKKR